MKETQKVKTRMLLFGLILLLCTLTAMQVWAKDQGEDERNPNNGSSGTGLVFIDDIGFGRPAPVAE